MVLKWALPFASLLSSTVREAVSGPNRALTQPSRLQDRQHCQSQSSLYIAAPAGEM